MNLFLRTGSIAILLLPLACTVGDVNGPDTTEQGDADAGPTSNGTPVLHSIFAGDFSPLAPAVGIGGRAQLTRALDGKTSVSVQLTGLNPDTAYTSHVHTWPCEFAGGGHYKMDTAIAEVVEGNEVWPKFQTNADGVGEGSITVEHLTRGDALSVVVHDPAGGAKLACADLVTNDGGSFTLAGTFAPFAGAELIDQTIAGTAELVRTAGSTVTTLAPVGLDIAATYVSHVHALPCATADAGGHYMMDPSVEGVVPTNEIQPLIPVVGPVTTAHGVRTDAQSVVIHRVVVDVALKVACADVERATWQGLERTGDAALLPAATEQGLDAMTATATMTRGLDGWTTTTLNVSGATANGDYKVHVHALPCDISDGGGHYKMDTTVTEAEAANEMWLNFSADATGAATPTHTVQHLARPEAQSLVIHGAEGARVACVDLD